MANGAIVVFARSITLIGILVIGRTSQQWSGEEKVDCPPKLETFKCTCLSSREGLEFNCNKPSLSNLKAVLSSTHFPIRVISIDGFAGNVTYIPSKTFANGSVQELKISNSDLQGLDDKSFDGPTSQLSTLAIIKSKLTTVPLTVSQLSVLRRLDLRSNVIREIKAYTFFGRSKLSSLNLMDNELVKMAENSFLGLEDNLRELNLEANNLTTFPVSAVKILKKLQTLNLAQNQIFNITADSFTRLESIKYLDISHNVFNGIDRGTLVSLPSLKTLDFSFNDVQEVRSGSLDGLHDLENLDLSYNSLTILPRDIFAHTRRLKVVNLSNNRIRSLAGVFLDLLSLEEVFLHYNLLLKISNDWFYNTPNLKTVHLQNNVIFEIEEKALQPLKRLSQLYLSSNFLNSISASWFRYNVALTALSLDNNHIGNIDPVAFR